jgi:peptidoglycan/LPS O-acetylase OafA/YrhL
MINSSKQYYQIIDILRAVAFLLVVLVHYSVPRWTKQFVDPNILETYFLAVIDAGWFGVPLFLVISGYSLAIGKIKKKFNLDIKKFFINRFLRIFPIWILILFILKLTHNLSGTTFLSVLFLNHQDMPQSAFSLGWSIQMEFYCYFLFPLILIMLKDKKQIFYFLLALITIRVFLIFLPPQKLFQLNYGTLFGLLIFFTSGVMLRFFIESEGNQLIKNIKNKILLNKTLIFLSGFVIYSILIIFIYLKGGWQNATGLKIKFVWTVFPEISSIAIILMFLPLLLKDNQSEIQSNLIKKFFAHIGKVSYSSYIFSMFVLDFVHVFYQKFSIYDNFMNFENRLHNWFFYACFFIIYLIILIIFSTITYNGIEKPFLKFRRKLY